MVGREERKVCITGDDTTQEAHEARRTEANWSAMAVRQEPGQPGQPGARLQEHRAPHRPPTRLRHACS